MKTHFNSKKVHQTRGWDWEPGEAKQMHRDVTAILEQHFAKFGLDKFQGMTNMFLPAYQVSVSSRVVNRRADPDL